MFTLLAAASSDGCCRAEKALLKPQDDWKEFSRSPLDSYSKIQEFDGLPAWRPALKNA